MNVKKRIECPQCLFFVPLTAGEIHKPEDKEVDLMIIRFCPNCGKEIASEYSLDSVHLV